MNEIVILSGKGGTGKTSITAAFASLNQNIVIADCDVDAANLHIILKPQNYFEQQFVTGNKALVNSNLCTSCGTCIQYCRFEAISFVNGKLNISASACEGCKLCEKVCPEKAISMYQNSLSKSFVANVKNGIMVHARLAPGEDNSGKLVTWVKNKARYIQKQKNFDIILVDGPPGIGCPVIASISGADKIVLVTEPTIAGMADLQRIIKLLKNFNGQKFIIVNKADINDDIALNIQKLAIAENIVFLGKIPYNIIFTQAMINCKSIIDFDDEHEVSLLLKTMWNKIIDNAQ